MRWRVYGVLALVLGAIGTMLGVNLAAAMAASRNEEALTLRTLRSTELADDIRWQIDRLPRTGSVLASAGTAGDARLQQLEADLGAYEPLATFENERPEWLQLRTLVRELKADLARGDASGLAIHAERANSSVKHLLQLNSREATVIGQRMVALRRNELVIDGAAGAFTLLLVFQIGAARLHSMERERILTAENLSLVQTKNRELETFAGRAAHDLRGPLAPIRGFADLIAHGHKTPEEMVRLGNRISAGVARMGSIIDAMLELSRSGQLPEGVASVTETVSDLVDELAPSLVGVRLSMEIGDHWVACAPHVLAQMLRNALSNALKYRAPERAPEVTISARVEEAFVAIEVSDNGVGMDPDCARRALEPFFRGQTEVAGHGLGLAIVDSYVRALGGSVEIESELNVGTRIKLRLPLAAASPTSRVRIVS